MLHFNDFVGVIQDGDKSIRVEHNTSYCSGSSKSLQVTRNPDGSISAYCHRCGNSGFYREPYRRLAKKVDKVVGNAVYLPEDHDTDMEQWPSHAKVWAMKSRLTADDIQSASIGFSKNLQRVIIPCFHEGVLSGYQARKIYDYDNGPKYYTKFRTDVPMYNYFLSNNGSKIIFCEDTLSALRLSHFVNSISLQGVHLKDSVLSYILNMRKYDKAWVWLDNDNPTVIQKRGVLRNKLSFFMDTSIIGLEREPKHHSEDELHKFLISKGIV